MLPNFEVWNYWTEEVEVIEALNEEHAIEIYKSIYGGEVIKTKRIN